MIVYLRYESAKDYPNIYRSFIEKCLVNVVLDSSFSSVYPKELVSNVNEFVISICCHATTLAVLFLSYATL